MRLALLKENLEGKIISNTIYNDNGLMFLKAGSKLTANVINRLKSMGITTIYIEDEFESDALTLQEVLDTQIKIRLIKLLNEIFNEAKKNRNVNYEKAIKIVEEIIDNINLSENAIMLNNFTKNDELYNLCNHSIDVTLISIIVASNKKYDVKKITNLSLAALLHDIGKVINDKSYHHAEIGYDLLKQNIMFKPTTYISVLHHHELEDGSGPLKIKGENIYEFAKIISISDMYINLINSKDNILPHDAIERITALGLNKINEDIYRAFVSSVNPYPNGLKVVLSNGEEGVVALQNKNMPTRPTIIVGERGSYRFINLEKELSVLIEKLVL